LGPFVANNVEKPEKIGPYDPEELAKTGGDSLNPTGTEVAEADNLFTRKGDAAEPEFSTQQTWEPRFESVQLWNGYGALTPKRYLQLWKAQELNAKDQDVKEPTSHTPYH
jgi:hypothetical protein